MRRAKWYVVLPFEHRAQIKRNFMLIVYRVVQPMCRGRWDELASADRGTSYRSPGDEVQE
jgi:hypothetical protein